MVTTEDIVEAYFDCRRTKRRKNSATKFEVDFEKDCYDLANEINNRTYEIGPSIAFFVTRPKKREVFAADFRDRVIHHWLMIRLEPLFEKTFIHDTYNCRKGKGTHYGVKRLYEKIKQISENYTKDCWVARFDMKGFFMSIHKPTLWSKLEEYIKKNYTNSTDVDDVLWVVHKVVMHCPENNCIKKSPNKMWVGFPKDKSLFTCGEENGLPIGNLTSQMFANFYLWLFDMIMVFLFGEGFGRYVDDFFEVCTDKKIILYNINKSRNWLRDNLNIKLHPNKIYIQYYTKGIKFTGGVVKPNRIYTANRTIDKFKTLVQFLNAHPDLYTTEEVICRVNSYLGFLKYTASYTIKRRIISALDKCWYTKLQVSSDYQKVVAICEQKSRTYFTNTIKERKELW